MRPGHLPTLAAALFGLVLASPAVAGAQLVSSDPAQGATVSKPGKITLSFSEPVQAALSGLDLVMTAMPGMEHHTAMKVPGVKVSVGPDGKSLVAVIARPLSTGSYEANWHAAAADARPVSGRLAFVVR